MAMMHQLRKNAVCTVFDGKIVVSDGLIQHIWPGTCISTNTVEQYDHVADEWSYMPSMVGSTEDHNLVAIKSKLFVIGRSKDEFEVFDKFTNRFVVIKSFAKLFEGREPVEYVRAVSIGNKIALLVIKALTIAVYDIAKDK